MHKSSMDLMLKLRDAWLPKTGELRMADIGAYNVNGTYKTLFTDPRIKYTGVDMAAGPNVDIIVDGDYRWDALQDNFYDVIISGQTLEHVEMPWLFAKSIERKIKPGGLVIIIAPWSWRVHRYPIDCWRILPDGIDALMTKWCGFTKLESGIVETDCFFVGTRGTAVQPVPSKPTMQRFDIINYLIGQNEYSSYLEIGCRHGDCFREIKLDDKTSVDPDPKAVSTVKATSDEFFRTNTRKWDIVFIDGLHTEEQVDKDIANALKYLTPEGVIVLHDCNPLTEKAQSPTKVRGIWNGTVWRSLAKLRMLPMLEAYVVDTDEGCGIVRRAEVPQTTVIFRPGTTYADLEKDRQKVLGLISVQQFIEREKNG